MQPATALPRQESPQNPLAHAAPPKTKRLMPLDRFLLRYTNREDPFKYEWNKGIVEKKPRTMNRNQLYIFQNLLDRFLKTTAFSQRGSLICEVDMYLPKADRTRRADIAYLSGAQMKASRDGDPSVCAFVAEVISKNDQINEVQEKLKEYFADGVQVVWVIFPQIQKVEVWRSVRDVTICFEDDVCSAAPVLDDFQVTANELFA
ncbi:MAG: Uma2 family endonuclease [Saprospiraceae bacterium]